MVQVQNTNPGDELDGVVEEVDSGLQTRFHSGAELLSFLRERFTRLQEGHNEAEGIKNERKGKTEIGKLNT